MLWAWLVTQARWMPLADVEAYHTVKYDCYMKRANYAEFIYKGL